MPHTFALPIVLVGLLMVSPLMAEDAPADAKSTGPLSYVIKDIHDKDYDLSQHRGQVVLMVNVASKCGFTKQYAGLEKLYRDHKDDGLVVIGFPANNFNQESGSDEEILKFCTSKYDVTFPMMSKISVKGDDIHPLFKELTTTGPEPVEVGWNFNKFLIGRDGKIIAHYPSKVAPDSEELTKAVEAALKAPKP